MHQDYLKELAQQLAGVDDETYIASLTTAVRQHPGDARPLVILAAHYAERLDNDRAEALYIAALELAPGYAVARFQLGLLKFCEGRPHTAFAIWQRLQELDPEAPLHIFVQAMDALQRGLLEASKEQFARSIARCHDNLPLQRDLQMLWDQISQMQTMERTSGPPSSARKVADDSTAHVLLSTYRQSC